MPPLLMGQVLGFVVGPVKKFIYLQRDLHGHSLSVVMDGDFHLPFLRSDFLRENLNGAAGNGTGGRVRAMLTRCSGPIGMKKRPDSMKPFERKKYGIQLHCDNFRTGRQTEPVRWPGFF